MTRNTDRYASRACRNLPGIGEKFRLPMDPTRSPHALLNPFYRHSWTIESFPAGQSSFNSPGLSHCVTVKRLADGIRRTIAQHHIARCLDL